MSTMEEFYKVTVMMTEKSMREDKTYQRAKNQASQYYQLLHESLSDRDLDFLDKLMKCTEKKEQRTNTLCFTNGFKKGFSAAFKAWD